MKLNKQFHSSMFILNALFHYVYVRQLNVGYRVLLLYLLRFLCEATLLACDIGK